MTVYATSVENVEYSMNAWIAGKINAYSRPSWLSAVPTFVFDFPDNIAPLIPAFSFIHIPIDSVSRWQGKRGESGVGASLRTAFLEVDAWVTRSDPNWMAQLRTMQSMIESATDSTTTVVILDFVTSQSNPAATSYRITVGDVMTVATDPDPNADIRRRRMMIKYSWIFRS